MPSLAVRSAGSPVTTDTAIPSKDPAAKSWPLTPSTQEKTRVFSVTVRPIRSPVLVSTTKALRVPSSSVVRSTTWPETGCTAPHAVRISTQEANRHPRHRCRFICAPLLSTLNRRMSIPWKSGEYHPFLKKYWKDGLFCTGNGRRLRMGEPPAGNSGKKMILL